MPGTLENTTGMEKTQLDAMNEIKRSVDRVATRLEGVEASVKDLKADLLRLEDRDVLTRESIYALREQTAVMRAGVRPTTPWFSVATGVSASVATIVATLSLTGVI